MNLVRLLLLTCMAGFTSFATAAVHKNPTTPVTAANIVPFSKGYPLEKLLGADILNPKKKVNEIRISQVAGTLTGPINSTTTSKLLEFTNPMYKDASTGRVHLFAPTLRVSQGESIRVWLKNELNYGPKVVKNTNNPNAIFQAPLSTNLHLHGGFVYSGVQSQDPHAPYSGGDNVFISVPPGQSLNYQVVISNYENPGLKWIHPHRHGSSGLQTTTSNGLVIVEDNPAWLPDAQGCSAVKSVLQQAKDVVLHFEVFLFSKPVVAFPGANADLDDTNVPVWAELSDPLDPLCCGKNNTLQDSGVVVKTHQNFVLLNGGYQPVISMDSGTWERWRVINTGFKNFLDLQILDQNNNVTPDCELMLLQKDSIYLNQIPRVIDHVFIASGNRAEFLVKCNKAGQYLLTSGIGINPFCGPGGYPNNATALTQKLATIKVSTPPSKSSTSNTKVASLTPKSCTPLRPAHSSDLTDASLKAHNAQDKLVIHDVSFTFGNQTYGCLVNDKNFTYPDPDPIRMPIGYVVEWPSMLHVAGHPLHTHQVPFQIQELDTAFLQPGCNFTSYFENGDWHDTLFLPMTAPLANGTGDSLKLRMQPSGIPGYTVMHCHSLMHEDEGCMKVMEYSCGNSSTSTTSSAGQPLPAFCDIPPPIPGTVNLQNPVAQPGRRFLTENRKEKK